MIDWDRVTELQSEIGAEGFGEVVELFLDEVDNVMRTLGLQPEKLEDQMHFLKGSAWNLGFRAFGEACQDGERLAAAGHTAEVDVARVVRVYDASKSEFMGRVSEFLAPA